MESRFILETKCKRGYKYIEIASEGISGNFNLFKAGKVEEQRLSSRKTKFRTEGLSAWFGSHQALNNISMKILKNEVNAIIGPSGCGKSTFIRCLNRMHEVVPGTRVEGKVLLDGANIYERGVDPVRVRRRVGMVFQKPNPFPTMSIRDNVLAGLRLTKRLDRSKAGEIVERALGHAALWDEVKDKLDK